MTSYLLPDTIPLLEVVASIAIFQNMKGPCCVSADSMLASNLIRLAGVTRGPEVDAVSLAYPRFVHDDWMLSIPETCSYIEALAMLSEVTLPEFPDGRTREEILMGVPRTPSMQQHLAFPGVVRDEQKRGIIICPFATRPELALPVSTWISIARMLRTYKQRVYVLGEPGERFDAAMFNENEILSEESIRVKLEYLASASLVVGVPNAWTWMATAWDTKMVYFYPDDIPARRWFPWGSSNFGRCATAPNARPFVLLAALRALIEEL